jgi:signal transduction histidine kinase/DNA-binding NarL/FixJ family response regulator
VGAVKGALFPLILVTILFVASFFPILFSFLHLSNNHYTKGSIDLADAPLYVKRGFTKADLTADASFLAGSDAWKLFLSAESDGPAMIMNAPLEGLPRRFFLDPKGRKEEEFTYAVPFFLSAQKKELLNNGSPGIFLNSIGDNWEIYLNGGLIRSEMYLDEAGRIRSHRAWRYPFFPLDKELLREGDNVLTIRIVGDPSLSTTGFFYGSPYYIDDYIAIRNDHTEFPIFFLCGIYLFVAVYHLLLYVIRRQSRHYLFHSIVSIILGFYFLFRSNAVYTYIPDSGITAKIEYMLIFLLLPLFAMFFEIFREQKIRRLTILYMIFCSVLAAVQLVFSLPFSEDALRVWQITGLIFITYFITYDTGYRTIVKGYRKWKFANLKGSFWTYVPELLKSPMGNFIVGIIVLFFSGIFDIFDSLFLNWGIVATRYSFFIFTIGASLILARDFGRLHNSLSEVIQELERTNVNLETKVYNRTRELEIQTGKAESASRAKSEFLARISHEIRTPLNAIIGLSEIELQKKALPETGENLGTIYNSGSMLLGIINEILDISKIEAGRFELTHAEYSIESVIADVVNLNLYRIGSKPLVFELRAAEDLPSRLLGDELRVKQILNNLLSNAFKYTDKGKVVLAINCEKQGPETSPEGRKVVLRFSVSDTGVGIKAEDIDRLFNDYTRLGYRSSQPVEGTGLGLAIARSLSKMMGGTITVESKFGSGSVFTAVIIQEASGNDLIGRAAAENLEAIRFSRTFRKNTGLLRKPMPYGRVLVVDDFESNLAVAKGLLAPYQISTDCVLSGAEAIGKIRAVEEGRIPEYDLIFMDHMMPGMDGIETVQIIRELDGDFARTIPIIALTANATAGIQDLFISKGFDGFIAKPIDLWTFDGILNQWVRNKHRDEAAAAEQAEAAAHYNESRPEAPFPSVEGIDLAGGFERYGGKEPYLEIVKAFCGQAGNMLERIEDPRQDMLNDYAIVIHGFKGSLFGICADELGNEAVILEKAAKSGDLETIQKKNRGFIERLETLVEKLKSLETGEKTKKGRKAKPDGEIYSVMFKAAREYNLNKMEDCIETLEEYDYDSDGDIVSWLRDRCRNLEYEEIIKRLAELTGETTETS